MFNPLCKGLLWWFSSMCISEKNIISKDLKYFLSDISNLVFLELVKRYEAIKFLSLISFQFNAMFAVTSTSQLTANLLYNNCKQTSDKIIPNKKIIFVSQNSLYSNEFTCRHFDFYYQFKIIDLNMTNSQIHMPNDFSLGYI